MAWHLASHLPERRSAGPAPRPAPTSVLVAAALAVAAELVLQRLLVRVGVHVPALPFLRQPYAWLTEAGGLVFPAAVVLSVAALGLTWLALAARLPARAAAVLAVTTALFPLAGLYAGLVGRQAGWEEPLALLYLAALIPAGAALLTAGTGLRSRAFTCLLVAGLGLGAAAGTPVVAGSGGTILAGRAGEAALLAAAFLAPVAFPAPRARRPLLAAALAGAAVALVRVGNGATTGILLLWGLGLTGWFPFYVYCVAAASLAYAVTGLLLRGRQVMALGLLFAAMGGLGLHNTYQSTVQLLGLAVLLLAFLEGAAPRGGAAEPAPPGMPDYRRARP